MSVSNGLDGSTNSSVFSDNSYNSNKGLSNETFLEKNLDKKIIDTISDLLRDICEQNNSNQINNKNIEINKKIKIFMLKKIPEISIKDYLLRLLKYSEMNLSTLILIFIYIDRLCKNTKFKLNYFNIYKFILTSMVIAIKYNEDIFYSSEYFAKLGGISKKELNLLEYEFLSLINFDLFVKDELFFKYHDLLINEII